MLAALGKLDSPEVLLEDDWGIHSDKKDVVFTARIIEQSKWACLPVQGGLDDQPAQLMTDIFQYLRLKAYIHAEISQGDRDE